MAVQDFYNVSPSDLKPSDILPMKVVAVIGWANDWAAYRGPTTMSDEDVAASGDKISAEQAEAMFCAPVAAGLSYRR